MRLINFFREVIALVLSGLVWIALIIVGVICFFLSAIAGWILLGVVLFILIFIFVSELMDR